MSGYTETILAILLGGGGGGHIGGIMMSDYTETILAIYYWVCVCVWGTYWWNYDVCLHRNNPSYIIDVTAYKNYQYFRQTIMSQF